MAWFNPFAGPTAEKLEQKGDLLVASGHWGLAKLEYERARRKLETAKDRDANRLSRLEEKIAGTRELLAREHHQHAAQLAAIGDYTESLDLVVLALEL
ncbi:MAG: hypothetical protein PVH26_02185, partial [Desulfosarcina sp.]